MQLSEKVQLVKKLFEKQGAIQHYAAIDKNGKMVSPRPNLPFSKEPATFCVVGAFQHVIGNSYYYGCRKDIETCAKHYFGTEELAYLKLCKWSVEDGRTKEDVIGMLEVVSRLLKQKGQ